MKIRPVLLSALGKNCKPIQWNGLIRMCSHVTTILVPILHTLLNRWLAMDMNDCIHCLAHRTIFAVDQVSIRIQRAWPWIEDEPIENIIFPQFQMKISNGLTI